MTEATLNALIIAVPSTLTALASFIVSVRNGRKSDEIHRAVNGMGDARNAATQTSAYAEGVLAQREAEGQKVGPTSPPPTITQ